jgi:hypothetical protein
MRRAILIAAVAASLSSSRWAGAQLADTPTGDAETAAPAAGPIAPADDEAGAAGAASPGTSPGVATTDDSTDPTTIEAERAAFWNSPEMTEARAWVLEYGRRSRQLGEAGALEYLGRVARLPLPAMRTWLGELNSRRTNLARRTEVTQTARQRMVEQTFERLQEVHDAQANAALNREQVGDALLSQRQFAEELSAARQASRRDQLSQVYHGPGYSWLAFPDWRTRAAAGASLPGDLPPGDPRNFLRNVPIDANGNLIDPGGGGAAAGAAAAAAAGVGPGGGPNVGAGAGGAP